MVFGELYRNGAEWKFRAVGQGYASGLRGIAQDFGGVNLQWTSGVAPAPQKKGLFGRLTGGGGGIDLDLACLWEFNDGSKGVVQALGNAFQAPYAGPPIIRLDRDDRSGSRRAARTCSSTWRVNEIRRILVFAFIYEGVPHWASADGVVTLLPGVRPGDRGPPRRGRSARRRA